MFCYPGNLVAEDDMLIDIETGENFCLKTWICEEREDVLNYNISDWKLFLIRKFIINRNVYYICTYNRSVVDRSSIFYASLTIVHITY